MHCKVASIIFIITTSEKNGTCKIHKSQAKIQKICKNLNSPFFLNIQIHKVNYFILNIIMNLFGFFKNQINFKETTNASKDMFESH